MIARQPESGGRVLFLSGLQLHPTISGGTLRSFGLVQALRHHAFDVRVHSLTGRKQDYLARRPSSTQVWPDGTEEHVERGASSALAWLGGYVVGLPPIWLAAQLAAAAASPGEALLSSALRRALAWCDAVVADFPFTAAIFSARSARGKLRILSTHNVEHRLCDERGPLPGRLLRRAVRRVEIKAADACDILVSCCDEDARFFETAARVRQSIVVPNGIDVRRFQAIRAHRLPTRRALGIPDDVMVFLFTGSKWGPNREAFEYLLRFASEHGRLLAGERMHIVVVGNVTVEPVRLPGLTATGRVEQAEPYFAAADAALNPLVGGAGTNVKMCEFIAARLPILSTPFGARGFCFVDGETGFSFERGSLAAVMSKVRRLFDDEPARLRLVVDRAYSLNEGRVDMQLCAVPLVEAVMRHHGVPPAASPARPGDAT